MAWFHFSNHYLCIFADVAILMVPTVAERRKDVVGVYTVVYSLTWFEYIQQLFTALPATLVYCWKSHQRDTSYSVGGSH